CCFSCYFFFSSRRRHTSSKRDWSSDVCSSDLHHVAALLAGLRVLLRVEVRRRLGDAHKGGSLRQRQVERRHLEVILRRRLYAVRSEERRVGKEGRLRRCPSMCSTKEVCSITSG